MTVLRVALPTSPEQLLLWSHVALLWILVNYVHRLDPLGQFEARAMERVALRRWRLVVGLRAGGGALLAAALAGWDRAGIGLGAVFFAGAALLPLIRVRWMRRETPTGWSDLRAEWELAVNVVVLSGSHAAIGLVLAAKGVVRAVEWQDRALVEYFLIGTLASAGLAALVGIGIGTVLGLS